jgi:hypothetical protein
MNNKYSIKIINFINKINKNSKFNLSQKINNNNPLVLKLKKIMADIIDSKSNIINFNRNKTYLGKMHTNEYPKIYLFFREYLNSTNEKISFDNYKKFARWFNLNQHNINYDKIYKNIKNNQKLVNIFNDMFQIGTNRENLHKMLHKNSFVGIDTIYLSEILDLEEYFIQSEYADIRLYFEKNQDVEEIISKILIIVTIMHEINRNIIKSNVGKLNLNIFLGKQRKQLTNNDILTPININSGSCMIGIYINIWREEELEKVLFHELLHYYGCDFTSHYKNYKLINDLLLSKIDIKTKDASNESINEMMAILLHMIYQTEMLNMELDIIYSYEIFFSMFQIAKIIRFFGGKTYHQLFKINSNHIKIKQTTSVASYYIIKGLLLFNINSTLDFLNKINLKVGEKEIILYKNYLENILKNDEISEKINELIKIIDELDPTKFIYKTLRMSAVN